MGVSNPAPSQWAPKAVGHSQPPASHVSPLLISAPWPSLTKPCRSFLLDLHGHSSPWRRKMENILRKEGRKLSPHLHSLGEGSRAPAATFSSKGWGTEPPPGSCLHKNCHLLPCSHGLVLSGRGCGSWATSMGLVPKPQAVQGSRAKSKEAERLRKEKKIRGP